LKNERKWGRDTKVGGRLKEGLKTSHNKQRGGGKLNRLIEKAFQGGKETIIEIQHGAALSKEGDLGSSVSGYSSRFGKKKKVAGRDKKKGKPGAGELKIIRRRIRRGDHIGGYVPRPNPKRSARFYVAPKKKAEQKIAVRIYGRGEKKKKPCGSQPILSSKKKGDKERENAGGGLQRPEKKKGGWRAGIRKQKGGGLIAGTKKKKRKLAGWGRPGRTAKKNK